MNTNKALTISNQERQGLNVIGAAANHAAARNVLEDYQETKAQETLRRQKCDIALFETYLAQAGLVISDMATNLDCWSGCTYGLADGFKRWMLREGYSTGSINVRLATVKSYCELASKYGSLTIDAYSLIRTVKGYRASEGRNVDDSRKKVKLAIRRPDAKKAEATPITLEQARKLKQHPATPKGLRDGLLICLLLDHGLRCGEISDLNVGDINLDAGSLVFYRHKVDLVQSHQFTADTWIAARNYFGSLNLSNQDQDKPLFAGPCSGERLSERTINARIATLGRKIGIAKLSPHDLRHYWATNAVRTGTDIKSLQDAGGWSSVSMPMRYVASSKVANSGVKLTV